MLGRSSSPTPKEVLICRTGRGEAAFGPSCDIGFEFRLASHEVGRRDRRRATRLVGDAGGTSSVGAEADPARATVPYASGGVMIAPWTKGGVGVWLQMASVETFGPSCISFESID